MSLDRYFRWTDTSDDSENSKANQFTNRCFVPPFSEMKFALHAVLPLAISLKSSGDPFSAGDKVYCLKYKEDQIKGCVEQLKIVRQSRAEKPLFGFFTSAADRARAESEAADGELILCERSRRDFHESCEARLQEARRNENPLGLFVDD